MSLLRLLADFPNYSARKVRRLANQLKWLDHSADPQAKNIAADLMDYNLQSAMLEENAIQSSNAKAEVSLQSMIPVSEALHALQDFKSYVVDEFGPNMEIDHKYTYLHERLNGPTQDNSCQDYVKVVSVDDLKPLIGELIRWINHNADVTMNETWQKRVDELNDLIQTKNFTAYRVHPKRSGL